LLLALFPPTYRLPSEIITDYMKMKNAASSLKGLLMPRIAMKYPQNLLRQEIVES
jgi:hypothetical protein